ncbi:unnamed protein product, partial [Pleuronectes platessa]
MDDGEVEWFQGVEESPLMCRRLSVDYLDSQHSDDSHTSSSCRQFENLSISIPANRNSGNLLIVTEHSSFLAAAGPSVWSLQGAERPGPSIRGLKSGSVHNGPGRGEQPVLLSQATEEEWWISAVMELEPLHVPPAAERAPGPNGGEGPADGA